MLNGARRLPVLIALVAFAVYVCTLGGGVTLNGLLLTARLAGWDNSLWSGQPLLWLVTLPLRLLPAAWLPLAVKLLAAVLAAGVVGILARTIQLLPWDHPWDSASRFAVVLPVLAGCGICGLEFNFWQEATSNGTDVLDVLLLAVFLWLVLEYNLRRTAIWLDAAAVVLGLGLAENWAFVLVVPPLTVYWLWTTRERSVKWLAREREIEWKLILRLAGLWLVGFLVYVLPPTANGLIPHAQWEPGAGWVASLHETKGVAKMLYFGFWQGHRLVTVVVLIYFLVPTLPLVMRFRDEGTSNKAGVDRFQIWIYRSLRLVLLLACFWLAFDPTTGPRQLVQHQMGGRLPLLTFDYAVALGVGFLMGNLLLVSQPVPARDRLRRSRDKFPWKQVAVSVAASGTVLAAIGLVVRNAPVIWDTNYRPVEEYGRLAVQSLPSGHGVVLCDFLDKGYAFQAALADSSKAADWLEVDTARLPGVDYRARLERRLPAGWLTDQNRHELTPLETVRLLAHVADTNQLFYLHPSYGYFFEVFYSKPVGAVYEMKLRGNDPLAVPPLPGTMVDANEQFWTGAWDRYLDRLVPAPRHPGWLAAQMQKYGLVPASRLENLVLANWFSMQMEGWGVALQREDHWRQANVRVAQALELDTNNIAARITLACNTNLQTGVVMGLGNVGAVADRLGGTERLTQIMKAGGPFDEPELGFVLASSFLDRGLLVEAAEELERVRVLTPGSVAPELALAEIYNRMHLVSRGRPLIEHLRQEAQALPANRTLDLDLALLDTYSSLLQTNVANARSALEAVVAEHPDDTQIADRVLAAYVAFGDLTNALQLVDAKLAKTPNDTASLNKKAMILVQSGHPGEAIKILDQVLVLTNQPDVRLDRALAYIANGQFEPAQGDLRELEKAGDDSALVNFGFALVAQHGHDTNQAVQYLQLCLSNAPAGSPLWQQASAHLRMLTPAAAAK